MALFSCAIILQTTLGADAPAGDSTVKPLEAMLDKALAAYNAGDAKAFWADFATAMKAMATEPTFNMMYRDQHMKNLGKFVSKAAIKAETVAEGEAPLLVHQAEFEKNKKVKISVNFMKQEGAFKLMQVKFDKM